MATAKRKSSTKKGSPNKVQKQWGTVVKKLSKQQKQFQTKIKAIRKDIEKKIAETETAIAKLVNASKKSPKPAAKKSSSAKAKKAPQKAKASKTKRRAKSARHGMEAA